MTSIPKTMTVLVNGEKYELRWTANITETVRVYDENASDSTAILGLHINVQYKRKY